VEYCEHRKIFSLRQLWSNPKQDEISYRCPGYDKPFYERFPTLEKAKIRCAEIELAKVRGDLRPPQKTTKTQYITVGELLNEYVMEYGLNHWGDSYLSCSRHRIEHYIKPYLGDMLCSICPP